MPSGGTTEAAHRTSEPNRIADEVCTGAAHDATADDEDPPESWRHPESHAHEQNRINVF